MVYLPFCLALSFQLCQQRFGLLEVCRIESLREPAIDFCQQLAGFGALALALPEATQAGGSTEVQPTSSTVFPG